MSKLIISTFCLTGFILLQGSSSIKELTLRMQRNPLLKPYIHILIESQSIPTPAISALAIRFLTEAHIAQTIEERSVYDESFKKYLYKCAQEAEFTRSMPKEIVAHRLNAKTNAEEAAFHDFVKAVHQRKICQMILEEIEDFSRS